MSFPLGGIADKLGNDYEYRFICNKILEMMCGEIVSIRCDSFEYDSRIDVICKYSTKEKLYQCKARNGSRNEWSIADLINNGIIKSMFEYVDENKEYHLITGISSIKLKDFFEKSRMTETIEELIQSSKETKKIFEELCNTSGIKEEQTFFTIKNVYIDTYSDDSKTKKDLEIISECLFNEKGSIIIPLLKEFVIKNVGKTIYKEDIEKYFKELGLILNKNDNTSYEVIQNLKHSFKKDIQEVLINNMVIHRNDTKKCLEKLESNEILIIHGQSGVGKSGVIYEMINELEKDNAIIVPLRLDRLEMKNSESNFSNSLGFAKKISTELVGVSNNRKTILIIDQLDALKNVGMASKNAQAICNEIIDNILTFNKELKKEIKIVICCRTYDLKSIPFINHIMNDNKKIIEQHEVQLLTEKELEKIEKMINMHIPKSIRTLVRNINNLKMWLYIRKDKEISNINDLIREFIYEKKEEMITKGCSENDIESILNYIVKYMDENATLSINKNEIQNYLAYQYLVSVGLLVENINNNVTFYHQSIFEYLMMKEIDEEIMQKGNIIEWIGHKEKQNLKLCYRIENYIKIKVQENTDLVYSIIKRIVNNKSIRFIIKSSCISALNMIRENNKDIEKIVIEKCIQKDYISMCNRAIIGNKVLTVALANTEIFKEMILSDNIEIQQSIKGIIYSGYQYCDEQIIEILEDIRNNIPEKKHKAIEAICFLQRKEFSKVSKKLQEYIINNFDDYFDLTWIDIKEYEKIDRKLFQEIIKRILIKSVKQKEKIRIYVTEKKKEDIIKKLSNKISVESLKEYIKIIDKINDENIYHDRIEIWFKEKKNDDENKAIIFIREVIIQAGKELLEKYPSKIISIFKETNNVITRMIATRILASDKGKNADLIYKWLLEDSRRFQIIKKIFNPYPECTYDLIKAISPFITSKHFHELEDTLYYYKDIKEIEYIKNNYEYVSLIKSSYNYSSYSYYYNRSKYVLLNALDKGRINDKTKELINVLERSITATPKELFNRYGISKAYSVKSTIHDVAEKISDSSWIKIITNKKEIKRRFNIKNGYSLESSHEDFARDFQRCSVNNPKRFCLFVMQHSKDMPIEYKLSIINALIEIYRKGDKTLIDDILEETIYIINEFSAIDNYHMKRNISELIGQIVEFVFDYRFVTILKQYAREEIQTEEKEYEIEDDGAVSLETIRINSKAGITIESISKILQKREEVKYLEFIDVIKEYIESPLKVKRYFAIPFLFELYFKNKDLSIELFIKAIKRDFNFLIYGYGNDLFFNIVNSNEEKLNNLIEEMSQIKDKEVAKLYGIYVSSRYIYYDKKKEELNRIIDSNNLWQKVGIIEQSNHCIYDSRWFPKSSYIILNLLDSSEKELCNSLSKLLCGETTQRYRLLNNNTDFINIYLSSKSILGGIHLLIDTIKEYIDNICDFSSIIFVLAINLIRNEEEQEYIYEIQTFFELLIRLNEQAIYYDNEIEEKSLDLIDEISKKYDINLNTYLKEIYN